MSTTTSEHPPPDAGEGPGKGPHHNALNRHDTSRCRSCGGHTPWDERRRNQAELEAMVRGYRRIIDLPEVV